MRIIYAKKMISRLRKGLGGAITTKILSIINDRSVVMAY